MKHEGLEGRIHFRGALPRPATPAALRESAIFVLASKAAASGDTEGTPVALMEAAAAGVPVVATRHAGIPELLPPEATEEGFLVPEGDVTGLASAIGRLSSSEPVRAAWGSACASHARAGYSAAAFTERLIETLWAESRIPRIGG